MIHSFSPKITVWCLGGAIFLCSLIAHAAVVVTIPASYETVQYTYPYPGFAGGTNYRSGYLEAGNRFLTSEVDSWNIYTLDLTGIPTDGVLVTSVNYSWSNSLTVGGVGNYYLTQQDFSTNFISGGASFVNTNIGYSSVQTNVSSTYVNITGNSSFISLIQSYLGQDITFYGFAPKGGRIENGEASLIITYSAVPEPYSKALLAMTFLALACAHFKIRRLITSERIFCDKQNRSQEPL